MTKKGVFELTDEEVAKAHEKRIRELERNHAGKIAGERIRILYWEALSEIHAKGSVIQTHFLPILVSKEVKRRIELEKGV